MTESLLSAAELERVQDALRVAESERDEAIREHGHYMRKARHAENARDELRAALDEISRISMDDPSELVAELRNLARVALGEDE